MGYSQQQFYEIRRNYQTYVTEDLIDRLPKPSEPNPNRVATDIERAILDHCLEHPGLGALRVARVLMLKRAQVSSSGVRGVEPSQPAHPARGPAVPGARPVFPLHRAFRRCGDVVDR